MLVAVDANARHRAEGKDRVTDETVLGGGEGT